ncbi:MAG: 4-phosphoerythronate dehydrogenase [Muribaculaceae bacterium]|nr:4-phosphoerythronate dehydrogenase [Muribaculaceae bacterium]
MKILIERNIPFVKGLLEPYAEVEYPTADEFTPDTVNDADALLVRTRTRCDSRLLEGSRVSFIGTATIGTDHIDLPWCAAAGIEVANAPGCNAPAVGQYVLSAISRLTAGDPSGLTLGIVGVGHVGSIVERWARQCGLIVKLNDPPRQAAEGGDGWSTLEEIAAEADIITFHTPLDATTRHIVGREWMGSLRRKPIIINAARGGIVDTPALVEALDRGIVRDAVIDCWEGEPQISPALLERAAIATPHIAGYSHEGKVRATRMAVDALCRHFGLPHIDMDQHVPPGAADQMDLSTIAASYNPVADTIALKASPGDFEQLRNHYILRHEPGATGH